MPSQADFVELRPPWPPLTRKQYHRVRMADLLATPPALEKTFGTGQLTIWRRPDLIVSRIEGHFSDEMSAELIACADPVIRRSKAFVGLHDWTDARTFDVMVPPRMAKWTIGLLSHVGRIVIVTQHPIVSMAVRTTNLTIRRIEHLGTRDEWLSVLRQVT